MSYPEEIAKFYFRKMPVEGASEILHFSFANSDPSRADTVTVLRLELPLPHEGGTVWFSGSVVSTRSMNEPRTNHRHQFVGAFLDDDVAFSELVAAAYHCNQAVNTLGHGSSFGLGERSPLRSRGYAGAVVLEPEFFPMFSDGEQPELSVPTTLFSVVPVTGDELNLKLSKGLDALLDAWSEAGKEVFRVTPERGTHH